MASSKMQRAREFVRRQREKARDLMVQVRSDAETVGAAAATGYVRGRFPAEQLQFGDIDVELIAGVPMKLLAYANVLGRSVSPDLHAISNGILACYAANQAYELGQEHRDQDGATQGRRAATRGMGPGSVSYMPGAQRQAAVR